MTQEEQPPRQTGIQSNSGGDINLHNSRVNIAGRDMYNAPQKERDDHQKRMLKIVHDFWIKNSLKTRLSGNVPIRLQALESSELVESPLRESLAEAEKLSRQPAQDIEILQMYEQAIHSLLLLGEPGMGKTTLLLMLADKMIENANKDVNARIPVILNLSTWSKGLSLEKWLIEELRRLYEIPREIAKSWIEKGKLILLLDGLDDVESSGREHCIRAINRYRLNDGYSSTPIVICCRSWEYKELARRQIRLSLYNAFELQPLTMDKIIMAVSSVGGLLADLQHLIPQNQELRKLLETPLMLSTLIIAYKGTPFDPRQLTGSYENIRDQIFTLYADSMFESKKNIPTSFTKEKTRYWLSWLAKQLIHHEDQNSFYLEYLQLDWLPEDRFQPKWLYPTLVVGFVYALFIALVKGLTYSLIFSPWKGLTSGCIIGLVNLFLFIFLNGYIFRFLSHRPTSSKQLSQQKTRHLPLISILYGIANGVINASLITYLIDFPAGIQNGITLALVAGFLGPLSAEVRPAEAITWSWRYTVKDILRFLGIGLLFGPIIGLATGLTFHTSGSTGSWYFSLGVGMIMSLLLALNHGLFHKKLTEQDIFLPNQGIRNAFKNSLLYAVTLGPVGGLLFWLIYAIIAPWFLGQGNIEQGLKFLHPNSGFIYGLTNGLAIAAFFWLKTGGITCLQHAVLRILLWYSGCTPWRYVRFLEYASKRILLNKEGGGYVFPHVWFRNYFAS